VLSRSQGYEPDDVFGDTTLVQTTEDALRRTLAIFV
jgi:hypothetical protein